MGRRTGSIKVRSRLNTVAMKTPSGLVTARTRRKKTAICSHPLAVISEFLRSQECVHQIDAHQNTDGEHDYRFQTHVRLLTSRVRKSTHTRLRRQRKQSW